MTRRETRGNCVKRQFGFEFQTAHPMSSPGLTGRPSIPETPRLESRSRGVMDAPVKPGHDSGEDASPHSRDTKCPSDRSSSSPLKKEGAGNTGCWPHPRALRAKKVHFAHASSDRAAETIRRSPCAMALRLMTCSPVHRLSSHRRFADLSVSGPKDRHRHTAKLDPSIGRSGPHAFTVRAGIARLSSQRVHRIPRPTLVTIA
jgi:hypothetical protein